jgi:hypothetical protein
MFGPPKCPKCENAVHQIDAKAEIIGSKAFGPLYHAVVATCGHCNTILGVLNEPSDTRQQLAKEMDALRKDMELPKGRR